MNYDLKPHYSHLCNESEVLLNRQDLSFDLCLHALNLVECGKCGSTHSTNRRLPKYLFRTQSKRRQTAGIVPALLSTSFHIKSHLIITSVMIVGRGSHLLLSKLFSGTHESVLNPAHISCVGKEIHAGRFSRLNSRC